MLQHKKDLPPDTLNRYIFPCAGNMQQHSNTVRSPPQWHAKRGAMSTFERGSTYPSAIVGEDTGMKSQVEVSVSMQPSTILCDTARQRHANFQIKWRSEWAVQSQDCSR